jgi:hypothetical protein
MDCKIIVFVHDQKDSNTSKLLKTFAELGYTTLADGIHGKNYRWLIDNIKEGKFFIFANGVVKMYDKEVLEEDMKWYPDFAIVFNEECSIDSITWEAIRLYCNQHLTDEMIDMTNTMKVHEVMGKPMKAVSALKEEEVTTGLDHYSFESYYIEKEDIMLYEVLKPFTDLPYTSVTRNYSKKGHLPFFTDLFICQSWGVARSDISFLAYMWKELKMTGVFDIEELMKEATEKCLPSETRIPEPEPEVYRRSLHDTILILREKAINKMESRFIP